MAGYYIHIPFCRQACIYCDFHFSTQLKEMDNIVNALLKEMDFKKNYLEGEEIETIYFGGGTPSLLTAAHINLLINKIFSCHRVSADAEITLEANPDDLNTATLALLKTAGINRLSIGVQSFHDDDLRYLKRIHDAKKALQCLSDAYATGFHDLTLDLIYGIPGQSDDTWLQNLNLAAQSGINHISAYSLTVEHRTALAKMIEKGSSPPIDEEQAARHFLLLQQWAATNDFLPYEISNFARKGFIARHNSGYWMGKNYIGIGPSAHSYNGVSRQWNIANNVLYIKNINSGLPYFESEILTNEQHFQEYIMTGMRTIWGCNIAFIENKFGSQYSEKVKNRIQRFIDAGNAVRNDDNISLTLNGRLIADHIIRNLV